MTPIKNQQGMVLVIGLIYLAIAMFACLSTFEGVGALSYEQASSIQKYKFFYSFESKLTRLENNLLKEKFPYSQLESFLFEKNILDISALSKPQNFDNRWNSHSALISGEKEIAYLVEFLGNKNIKLSENKEMPEGFESWVFRISIGYQNGSYLLQSLIQIFPIELENYLILNGEPQHISRRIAWNERIVDE